MPLLRRAPASSPRIPSRKELRRQFLLRRLLAAALVGAAVWIMASMLGASTRGGQAVLVAATDLPAGHPLTAADVTTRHVPSDLAPEAVRAVTTETISAGKVLTAPVSAGEALSTTRLRSPTAFDSLGPGMRAVHITLRDTATAGILDAGSAVDVYSGVDGTLVHPGATVVQVDTPGESGGLTDSGQDAPGAVLAVPASAADTVMAAVGASSSAGTTVHVALRSD